MTVIGGWQPTKIITKSFIFQSETVGKGAVLKDRDRYTPRQALTLSIIYHVRSLFHWLDHPGLDNYSSYLSVRLACKFSTSFLGPRVQALRMEYENIDVGKEILCISSGDPELKRNDHNRQMNLPPKRSMCSLIKNMEKISMQVGPSVIFDHRRAHAPQSCLAMLRQLRSMIPKSTDRHASSLHVLVRHELGCWCDPDHLFPAI